MAGGDRVGGNNPPPSTTQAQDIVRNIFEGGDKTKPLTQQQQLQHLQEQARNQENLRSAADGTASRGEAGESGRSDAAGRDGARAEGRPRANVEVPRRESAMDAFLNRNSQLQQARDAGKDANRPTLSSMSAQAWSVGGSPQTPEGARTLIHQSQPNPSGPMAHPPTETLSGPPLTPFFSRPLSTPTFTGRAFDAPAAGLLIRYASAFQSGGETAARAFQGRSFGAENLARQLGRLMQDAQGGPPGQTLPQTTQVAVHIRGPLVFVRDGDKFRAFRLNADGSLSEMPSEDANGQPLSPEAQAALRKVLRQKGPQTKMEGGGAEELGELSPEELAELEGKETSAEEAGDGEEALDFETRFALLLHAVLEEDHQIGKQLGPGEDPSFPVKGDWEAFFANLMGLGNQEKADKKTLDQILNMMFRGLFKKQGSSDTLVGDLKYLKDGKTKEEKFAQVEISDAKLLAMLAELKPGQKISKELLQKHFGEELSYLQMAHLSEKVYNMASSAEKNVIFNPKAQYDAFSQARLEQQLFASRKNPRAGLSADSAASDAAGQGPAQLGKNGFFANVYEQMGMRERYRGKPRIYVLIAYTIMLAAFGLLALFLLKAL